MKIEKINDNQIRIFLNENDLLKRDIKLNELAYGSEKTQRLFKEMMDEAMKEHGFYADNMPLIIEAVPIAIDSIMIIITKVDSDDKNGRPNFLAQNRELRKFKRKLDRSKDEKYNESKNKLLIYSFYKLDDLICLTDRLSLIYEGKSMLYKYDEKYYFVLETERKTKTMETVELIMNEYGEKLLSNELGKHFLIEHAEMIIAENAIEKLMLI